MSESFTTAAELLTDPEYGRLLDRALAASPEATSPKPPVSFGRRGVPGSLQVWLVGWPHEDGSHKDRPAVSVLRGEDVLLLKVTSHAQSQRNRPEVALLSDALEAGLREASSLVHCGQSRRVKASWLQREGYLLGQLSAADGLAVAEALLVRLDAPQGPVLDPAARPPETEAPPVRNPQIPPSGEEDTGIVEMLGTFAPGTPLEGHQLLRSAGDLVLALPSGGTRPVAAREGTGYLADLVARGLLLPPAPPEEVPAWTGFADVRPGLLLSVGTDPLSAAAGDAEEQRVLALRWQGRLREEDALDAARELLNATPWADESWLCTADADPAALRALEPLAASGLGVALLLPTGGQALLEPEEKPEAPWYVLSLAANRDEALGGLARRLAEADSVPAAVREEGPGQDCLAGFLEWIGTPAAAAAWERARRSLEEPDVEAMYHERAEGDTESLPPVLPFQVRLLNWSLPGKPVRGGPGLLLPSPQPGEMVLLKLARGNLDTGEPEKAVALRDVGAAGLSQDSTALTGSGWRRGEGSKMLLHSKYLGTLVPEDAAAVASGFRAALERRTR